jgi:hypothetical protein
MAAPIPPPYPAPDAAKTTPAQICRWALMSLGRLGANQPLDGDDLIVSFEMLNGMIDAWKLNELLLNHISRAFTQLVAGKERYNIGPGGDFGFSDQTRAVAFPPSLLFASLLLDATLTPQGSVLTSGATIERPLGMPRSHQNLPSGVVASQVVTDFPDRVFYVPMYRAQLEQGVPPGCGVLWIYPTPNNNRHVLCVWYPEMLDTFIEPLAEYYLAPGMVRALRTNLAMEIAPLFNADPSPVLRAQAKAAYDWLQMIGGKPNEMMVDRALMWRRSPYNLFADDWNTY